MNIAERIKKLRKRLKLTQKEITSKLSIESYLQSFYETGHKKPTTEYLQALVKVFGVNMRWLKYGKGGVFQPSNSSEPDTSSPILADANMQASSESSSELKSTVANLKKQLTNLNKKIARLEGIQKHQEDIINNCQGIINKISEANQLFLEKIKKKE